MTKVSYGGQAVIEGVMMQGPKGRATAVRLANGKINIKVDTVTTWREKYPILKLPVLRGCVNLVESMITGLGTLNWSAMQAGEEEEQLSKTEMVWAMLFALVLSVGLFIVLPVFVGSFAAPYVGNFGRSFTEGLIRAVIFLGYVVAIRQIPDIKRLFRYHGAEHKTISCYEAGEVMIPENAVKYSTIHPRCGTSFILMAFIMMIIIFTFVGQTVWYWRAIIKIALMPLVAGISYEVFRLPLKFPNSIIVKALVAPGLWMQKLTTAEPDLAMLEVAMSALKAVPEYIPTEKDAALLREQEMQTTEKPLEAPAEALPEQMKLDKQKENQAGYASATVWNG